MWLIAPPSLFSVFFFFLVLIYYDYDHDHDYDDDYDYFVLLCSAICFLGRGGVVRAPKEYNTIQSSIRL